MKEEKYNQEEEGFNLRLGSPIPTPTLTDQESPIMFGDSCSLCGSKKRRLLSPDFGKRKKTILIDPSSMKEASSTDDDERSQSRLSSSPSSSSSSSSSLFHQIPNSSPPHRSVSDVSSSGSFSSPQRRIKINPNIINKGFNPTDDQESPMILFCPRCGSKLLRRKTNPSSSSMSVPPPPPPPPTATTDCSCRFTELPLDVLTVLFSYLPKQVSATIPFLCQALLKPFTCNQPTFIDSGLIRNIDPLWLHIDFDRIEGEFSFRDLEYRERSRAILFYLIRLLNAHREKLSVLWLSGTGTCTDMVTPGFSFTNRFENLKTVRLYQVLKESNETLVFPNVKILGLSISLEYEKEGKHLFSLLRRVPILEQLFIQMETTWSIFPEVWRSSSSPILLDHLTHFSMAPLKGTNAEIEFLGLVLMTASILKKVELVLVYGLRCSSISDRVQAKLMNALQNARRIEGIILGLPRLSPVADVTLLLHEGFLEEEGM